MGRPPIGRHAMTAAERQQRHRSNARKAMHHTRQRPLAHVTPPQHPTIQHARALVDALPQHERYNLALYVLCKLTSRQRHAFETWHNSTFAHALKNEQTRANK